MQQGPAHSGPATTTAERLPLKACVDVSYRGPEATSACLLFER